LDSSAMSASQQWPANWMPVSSACWSKRPAEEEDIHG
jgi:hypothetical protein